MGSPALAHPGFYFCSEDATLLRKEGTEVVEEPVARGGEDVGSTAAATPLDARPPEPPPALVVFEE